MLKVFLKLFIVFISCLVFNEATGKDLVGPEQSVVTGHGLKPDEVVLPARYFFIQAKTPEGVP